MDHTVPLRFTAYAGMDIGRDNGMPVDRSYPEKAPFAFTGTIKKVVFDLKPDLATRRSRSCTRGPARRRRWRHDGMMVSHAMAEGSMFDPAATPSAPLDRRRIDFAGSPEKGFARVADHKALGRVDPTGPRRLGHASVPRGARR